MARYRQGARWLLVLLVGIMLAGRARAGQGQYRTGFVRWRAADNGFFGWQRAGTAFDGGNALCVDPSAAQPEADPYPAGGYHGGSYYNGGSYLVGEATSPAVATAFPFAGAVASWNAETPPGTWVETLIRAQVSGRWTRWYNLGVWAADGTTVARHSVGDQGDADGEAAVDTLVLSHRSGGSAFQLRLRLFSEDGLATPLVRNASVAYSTSTDRVKTPVAGNPQLWNRAVGVPECSQMVYPDGGTVYLIYPPGWPAPGLG